MADRSSSDGQTVLDGILVNERLVVSRRLSDMVWMKEYADFQQERRK